LAQTLGVYGAIGKDHHTE